MANHSVLSRSLQWHQGPADHQHQGPADHQHQGPADHQHQGPVKTGWALFLGLCAIFALSDVVSASPPDIHNRDLDVLGIHKHASGIHKLDSGVLSIHKLDSGVLSIHKLDSGVLSIHKLDSEVLSIHKGGFIRIQRAPAGKKLDVLIPPGVAPRDLETIQVYPIY